MKISLYKNVNIYRISKYMVALRKSDVEHPLPARVRKKQKEKAKQQEAEAQVCFIYYCKLYIKQKIR